MAPINSLAGNIGEIPPLLPSVIQVETAIPAFIGYTEKAILNIDGDLTLVPKRISSMLEYELYFGKAFPEVSIELTFNSIPNPGVSAKITNPSKMLMYYSMQLFYANGGGDCYIVSVGSYTSSVGIILKLDLENGLSDVAKIDAVTLILFPDGLNLATSDDYYSLYKMTLDQCLTLQDRFAVMDVWIDSDLVVDNVSVLRIIIQTKQ